MNEQKGFFLHNYEKSISTRNGLNIMIQMKIKYKYD